MSRKHRKHRKARRHSRKSPLSGFFNPKNKFVWAGVGAAAVVVYIYRKEIFGMDDGKVGYMAPTYNTAATLTNIQGW